MNTDEHRWGSARLRCVIRCSLWVWVSFGISGESKLERLGLREGDLVFQTSRSSQSRAIQLATHSKWSHMGMLVEGPAGLMVFEAMQPVRLTPLVHWIRRGEGGHFVAKRLKDADSVLDTATLARMRKVGRRFLGKPYDLTFEWDDRRIYCSELVWKVFKDGAGIEIGRLQRLREFDLSSPAVRKKMKERYGKAVPSNELVISPQRMFESSCLITVVEH